MEPLTVLRAGSTRSRRCDGGLVLRRPGEWDRERGCRSHRTWRRGDVDLRLAALGGAGAPGDQ